MDEGTAGQDRDVAERSKSVRVPPKWEAEARERLRQAIEKFSRPLADLIARDANEGDTRFLITDFLCHGLGYDKYEDLTTEYQVKGEFADYGVRLDKQLVAFIEVKRCTTKLGEKHLRQVQSYAVNEGVEWLILTNGAIWQVWHLTGGLPVGLDKVTDVDILSNDKTVQARADELFPLCKESLKRNQVKEVWLRRRATSPKSLCQVILSETVLDAVRKELRRQTDHNPSVVEIGTLLRSNVLRPELCD